MLGVFSLEVDQRSAPLFITHAKMIRSRGLLRLLTRYS